MVSGIGVATGGGSVGLICITTSLGVCAGDSSVPRSTACSPGLNISATPYN